MMGDYIDFNFGSVVNDTTPDDEFVGLRGQLVRIEAALEAGDVDAAKSLMREHVGQLRKVVGGTVTGNFLEEERDRLRKEMFNHKGTWCGACDRKVKANSLPFSGNNAVALLWMKRYNDLHPGEFVHVPSKAPKFMGKDGEFARMRHWGLTELAPNYDDKKKSSGLWRIKERGVDFADGRVRIQQYIVRYNSELLGLHGPLITLWEGTSFDYRDLYAVDLHAFEQRYEKLQQQTK